MHDRRFELLRRAYVEARYSMHYEITGEELRWLAERISHLLELIEESCQVHLKSLELAAGE